MNFIFSHSSMVDAEILQGVIYNKDEDISLALNQIHQRSLVQPVRETFEKVSSYEKAQVNIKKSYAEVVKDNNASRQGPVYIHEKPIKNYIKEVDWNEKKKRFSLQNLMQKCQFQRFDKLSRDSVRFKIYLFLEGINFQEIGSVIAKNFWEAMQLIKNRDSILFRGKMSVWIGKRVRES